MEKPTGFTLIEFITSTAIATILSVMAIPSFTSLIQKNRVHTATLQLFESVQLTRSHAIKGNARANLSHLGRWEDGWEVYFDANNNGERDEKEVPLFQAPALHESVRVHGNRPVVKYVSYLGTGASRWATHSKHGGAFQAGTFTICPKEDGAGYQLILARGGRMRIKEIEEEECLLGR